MASKFEKPSDYEISYYFPKVKKTFKKFWKVKRIDKSLGLVSIMPRGYPLILVNKKTQQALASIHVSIRNNQNHSLMIHRPNNNTPIDSFQCVLPSDGQIQFTITNLTTDMVNINLMRSNDKVTEVNPGPILSINQVNELHEFDCYTVERDQKTDKTMIIHPIMSTTGDKITMNDIDSKKSDSTCFQIFPSVIPKIDHPFAHLFGPEETEWVSVKSSAFLIPLPKIHQSNNQMMLESCNDDMSYGPRTIMSIRPLSVNLQCAPVSKGTHQRFQLPDKVAQSGEFKNITKSGHKQLNSIDTGATYAAQVTSGDFIQENTSETGLEYLYDKHSPPNLVRFSINNQQSEFLPNVKFFEEDLVEAQQQYISGVARPTKIYKDETCCICLEPEPLDVICTCGHVIHKSCFLTDNSNPNPTKCPLCRSRVVLVTPLSVFA